MAKIKLIHAQTILPEETLQELKELSGEHETKECLSMAVEFYIDSKKAKVKKNDSSRRTNKR